MILQKFPTDRADPLRTRPTKSILVLTRRSKKFKKYGTGQNPSFDEEEQEIRTSIKNMGQDKIHPSFDEEEQKYGKVWDRTNPYRL